MKKVLIIAEAGVNSNGQKDIAYKLIDAAYEAGADIVKFQTAVIEEEATKNAKLADYQTKTTYGFANQVELAKKIHLPLSDFQDLKNYSEKKGIRFLSTAFSKAGVKFLDELGIDLFKIPSGEVTNYPYLCAVGKTKKPVILSTGLSTLGEIKKALEALTENGTNRDEITVLHCNTEYPTPMKDVNLKAMKTIHKAFNVPFGYSDHTMGIEIPIAAVALGATVIEKHFTLDRTMEGPDHKASLEPNELMAMVCAIRNIEQALGNGLKVPSESEQKNINLVRKSIVAQDFIKKGTILTEELLAVKRPGTGISPMLWESVLGQKAKKDYQPDEPI